MKKNKKIKIKNSTTLITFEPLQNTLWKVKKFINGGK